MAQDGQDQPTRPKISLPSFREVQAAQRPRPAPSLFQANGARAHADSGVGPSQPSGQARYAPSGAPHSNVPNQAPGPQTGAAPSAAGPGSSSVPSNAGRAAAGPPSTSYPQSSSCRPAVDYKALNVSPNAVLVSRRQEGNPLLKCIRNVHIAYADIVPDYIMGADTCALFLSMRFHLLKPEYIHHRIKELQRSFRLKILMCHVDIDDVVEPLQQITRAALLNDFTLICGWTPEECARYLETFKVYETKPPDAILGRTEEDYLSRLNAALTTVRGVNKTDALTLGTTFGTVANAMQASMEDLSACAGIGPTKVKRLYDAFHEPFRKTLQHPAAPPATNTQQQMGQLLPATGASAAIETLPQDTMIEDSDDSNIDTDL